jgi:16S rRNA (guanine527-N7)-methyltransferase
LKGVDVIRGYFPHLTHHQLQQLQELGPLYAEQNQRVNVISRQDIGHLYVRHVLHSLAIAKFTSFEPCTRMIDLGTGGGFPGLPLAILYPQVQFYLVDAAQKKLRVVSAIAGAIGLENVEVIHARGEKSKLQADFVICRAVAPLQKLIAWSRSNIDNRNQHALANGLIALKGGDLEEELRQVQYPVTWTNIQDYFREPFFKGKKIVYVPISDPQSLRQ